MRVSRTPPVQTGSSLATGNNARRPSLRRKLSWALLGGIALLWLLLSVFGLYGVYRDAQALANAQLDHTARVLLAVVAHEIEEYRRNANEQYHRGHPMVPELFEQPGLSPTPRPPAYVVRSKSGEMILHSNDAGPLLQLQPQEGYSEYHDDQTAWRVLSLSDPVHDLVVTVAQTAQYRRQLANALALRFIVPLLIALPLLFIIIRVAVARGLRSLRHLATEVSERSTTDRRPLTDDRVPIEVLPLTSALDDLLTRLQQVREREQRFIADAAHELRTPLAGIKTQGQVAQSAAEPAQRDAALVGLIDGVDRASRLISQLLTLARLNPAGTVHTGQEAALLPAVQLVCAQLATVANKAGVELKATGSDDCEVMLNEVLLGILVRNLVENAIHASPAGQAVTIDVSCGAGETVLKVRDRGAGISPDHYERVFERFYRAPGTATPGAGLGLSIVKRVAAQGHARVHLQQPPEGGLEVSVVFGDLPAWDSSAEC